MGLAANRIVVVTGASRGAGKGIAVALGASGAEPKLNKVQQRWLLRLLEAGPEATGFAGQLWTGPRVGELIQREFGVSYHERYLPTLLRSLGWSVQKPKRRASERKEEVIAEWIKTRWPRIKKKPVASAQHSCSSTKPDF